MSQTLPIPDAAESRPLAPPLGLPSWQATLVALFVLSFLPLINLVVWFAAASWVFGRYRERGSGARMLADLAAATPLANAFRRPGHAELVDSEIGPVLRLQNPGGAFMRAQGADRPQSSHSPLVLHLELSTAQGVPVGGVEGGAPLHLKTWYKPWTSQPAFLVPLAPLELEEADRDGLVVNGTVQMSDAMLPGKVEARIPAGFLDRAAPRPTEPKVRPGRAHDLEAHDPCPVCAEALGDQAVTCQACGASQHPGCLELTGICPGFGCG